MIILIGLPKSGTSSFQYLFKLLGKRSYHWNKRRQYIGMMIYKNKKDNKPLLNHFCDTDVITQMDVCISENISYWPQIIDYEQLHKENPDSVFILNKRDPTNLLKSFKKWDKLDERLYKYSPEIVSNKTDEGFIEFVEKFYKDVENYFSKYPTSKFITYDIENDDIKKLEKYIDIKNIANMPYKNKN